MKYKVLKVEEGAELDESQIAVLKAIDEVMHSQTQTVKADKKELEEKQSALQSQLEKMAQSQNFEVIQKQLNELFNRVSPLNAKPVNEKQASKKERELNNKWVKSLVKKDIEGMKKLEMELKESSFEPFMHTGTQVHHDNYLEQGSYLIPELFLAEVQRFVFEAGIARREMRYLPFGGPGNERRIPVLTQSVVVEWVEEAGRKPLSKPYIGQVIQRLKKLAVIVPFTDEILDDSAIDLMGLVAQLIGEAIAIEEDRVFFQGSILAGDPFDGILNSLGVGTFQLGVGDLVADLTADDLEQVIYEIPTPARAGAKWYMHPTVFSVLRRIRVDVLAGGDNLGQYLIQMPTGAAPATMWNYPIVLTDELPAASEIAAGEPFMFFANLSRTSVYGDKGGLALKMLDQASLTDAEGNTVNLAQNDMTAIRAVKRVGYVNTLPQGICVVSTGNAT
ncbi:MAG: phage major capsid protein [Cryomorphaceae bacterium]|nr:MAG: phage major capsid protein [Cryomorphaceae bacterium]